MLVARLAALVPLSLAACGYCDDFDKGWFCFQGPAGETNSESGTSTESTGSMPTSDSTDGSMSNSMSMDTTLDTTAETTSETTGSICGNDRCDPGDPEDCPEECVLCGNGIVEGLEDCDDGPANTSYASGPMVCNTSCSGYAPYCGDMVCQDPPDEDNNTCPGECPAECQNGVVEAGEQCDDGNVDNTDACRNNCTEAVCGDGTVWAGVEECDDGNVVNTDGCLDTCVAATCGDSFVQAGVEECDDGNASDVDLCDSSCNTVVHRKVFLTKTNVAGNIAGMPGLAGADAVCNAEKGALTGSFKAWLSDSSTGPVDRFDTTFTGVYELPGLDPMDPQQAILVAVGWSGLTSPPLAAPINRHADGSDNVNITARVWTNTAVDGSPLGANHCDDWSTTLSGNGANGRSSLTDSQWTVLATDPCDTSLRLYCFEDPA